MTASQWGIAWAVDLGMNAVGAAVRHFFEPEREGRKVATRPRSALGDLLLLHDGLEDRVIRPQVDRVAESGRPWAAAAFRHEVDRAPDSQDLVSQQHGGGNNGLAFAKP